MAGLEYFEFRHDAGIADRQRHRFEVRRRVDEDVRPHIHAAHVEAADVGLESDHMPDALGWTLDGRARPGLLWVLVARHEACARPGGQVDEDVAAAAANAIHDLLVEGRVHAWSRSLRIAHMDVNDGRAGL